jgi:hypothetical protein
MKALFDHPDERRKEPTPNEHVGFGGPGPTQGATLSARAIVLNTASVSISRSVVSSVP